MTIDFSVLSELALNRFHQRQKDGFDTLQLSNEFASVLEVLGQVDEVCACLAESWRRLSFGMVAEALD